jgi:hypothetical protein
MQGRSEREAFVHLHPMIELSNDHQVRQAKGFKDAAAGLSGEELAGLYQTELANAPKRAAAGKKFLVKAKPPTTRRPHKDEEHLSLALLRYCRDSGEGMDLPRVGNLDLVAAQIPLATASVDRSMGDADPNKGVGKIDLLGVGPEDRLVVAKLKFAAPGATRGGTGDTPLRAFLDGLALTAIASANRESLASELVAPQQRTLSDEPAILALVATPRYWDLCRKREAQKGAAWIKEMERLASEVEEWIGLQVLYLAIDLEGDPGWEYGEEGPVLLAAPQLTTAWEARAGVVKPKAKPRSKSQASALEEIVEADLSRPIRAYLLTESYSAGDRISHPTLGTGVVQGSAGVGKVRVLFDEKKALLVHQRPPASPPI